MKKALLVLIPLSIFCVVLEVGARMYHEAQGYYRLNPMVPGSKKAGGRWKKLPYGIRLKDSRISRSLENGKVVLDVPYSIDAGSRRVSLAPTGKPTDYLIFLGCSFTFGAGVLDHETLPSQFQKLTNHFRVYNYGVGGASPREIYYRLQNISPDELQEKNGRVIYSYFAGHLSRQFYKPEFIARWGYRKNVYEESGAEVKNLGRYADVYPMRTFFYKLIWSSSFSQLVAQTFSEIYSDEELSEFADYIGKMSVEARRLSGKRLVVIIWPNSTKPDSIPERLRKQDIDLIDLSQLDLEKLTNGRHRLPYDNHPTGEAYAVIAQHLLKNLDHIP